MRVSAAGGTPSAVIPAAQGNSYAFPAFLPDGRHFLYLRGSTKAEATGFYVGSLDVKPEQQSTQRLMDAAFQPVYVPASDSGLGHIVFLRDGTLLAQPFDAGRLQLAGEAIPIAEQVASISGLGYFSASENGALAYRTGAMRGAGLNLQLSWFDRTGKPTLTAAEPSRSGTVKISPDGKRAALVRTDPQSNNADIWIVELATGASNRLTFDPGQIKIHYGRQTGVKSYGNPRGEVHGESTGRRRTDRAMTSSCTSRLLPVPLLSRTGRATGVLSCFMPPLRRPRRIFLRCRWDRVPPPIASRFP